MKKIPVITIFDVGKTNKKLLLFDEQYKLMHEENTQLEETKDEDNFPCEDVEKLAEWVKESFNRLVNDKRYSIKAVNFSAYGASFVYVSANGKVITPLYNYLKAYPEKLKQQFYNTYGGESLIAKQTASPVLGSLNSGMQFFRLKYEQPDVFKKVAFAFHLPQYLSYILTDYPATDITSIGCHTNLWHFKKGKYHRWVSEENLEDCFAPILPCNTCVPFEYNGKNYIGSIGLHDSSAALIPYLISFTEPFVLISTGTWCITLNPFNYSSLSDYELQNDCLIFLSSNGSPVKASRLFTGYEHEQQIKKLSEYFDKPLNYYKTVQYNFLYLDKKNITKNKLKKESMNSKGLQSFFSSRDLNDFAGYEEAYHQLIADLIEQQIHSTNLVLRGTAVKRIFVDGGFANNSIFMNLLANAFPEIEVYAASVPYASALGAALVIHKHWNTKTLPSDIIELKLYSASRQLVNTEKLKIIK